MMTFLCNASTVKTGISYTRSGLAESHAGKWIFLAILEPSEHLSPLQHQRSAAKGSARGYALSVAVSYEASCSK